MAIVGVESDRGAALAGRPITSMLSNDVANPLIIVDEICNARTITTTRGANHAFANALLSLLEPATALSWECIYFRLRFDMSPISWVLTSNNINNVPAPVRNCCQVIKILDLSNQQLQCVARKEKSQIIGRCCGGCCDSYDQGINRDTVASELA